MQASLLILCHDDFATLALTKMTFVFKFNHIISPKQINQIDLLVHLISCLKASPFVLISMEDVSVDIFEQASYA